jgi:L-fuconolactonase
MRVDSHQHFWRYTPAQYPWIQPGWPIRRDFLPLDLEPELRACGLDGCVAVQARQTLEESRWLLSLADASPFIKGVVGWVDLCSSGLEAQLTELAAHPKFVGVRHVVQDEPDDRFMLRADFQRGISALSTFDLSYDVLVFPRQLPAAVQLAKAFPEQRFVLDHLAKPPVREAVLSPWNQLIRELAKCPNVMCKMSGLVTEAQWHTWEPAQFQPYLDTVFNAFGPERLMFGSDWPVALLSGSYQQVYQIARDFLAGKGEAADKIFGDNATLFYDL